MPQLAWSKGRPGAKRRLALLVGGALFLLLAYRDASVAKSSNVSVMAIVAVVVGTLAFSTAVTHRRATSGEART